MEVLEKRVLAEPGAGRPLGAIRPLAAVSPIGALRRLRGATSGSVGERASTRWLLNPSHRGDRFILQPRYTAVG